MYHPLGLRRRHTSGNTVYFVLNEEIYQWHKSSKETAGKSLAVLECSGVLRAQSNATHCPWQCCNEVRDHEDIMPVVIIGGGYVCPSSAGQSPKDAYASDELGKGRVRSTGQGIPKTDQCESRACVA